MTTHSQKHTVRNLIIFGLSVLLLSAIAGVIEPLTRPPGSGSDAQGLGQLLWIVTPAAVALLLRLVGGDGWNDIGLRPNIRGNGMWWLASLMVFPMVIGVAVLAGVLLGWLELDIGSVLACAGAMIAALIPAIVKNAAEEFAWRGYLAPKVYSLKLNPWLSHGLVGLVWGLWHLPFVYVFWSYLTPGMLWYFVPLLLVGTMVQSVVYGEIRLATGSVLPAWIMHTIGNTIGNALLLSGYVRLVPGRELLASPGAEGALTIVLMLAVGYWLHRRRT